MKKIRFTLFSFLLFLAINMAAQQVPKVVGSITNLGVVSRNGPNGSGQYGFQFYNRPNIDASGSQMQNLVLKMRVYIDNLDNPGDVSFIQSTGYNKIEFGTTQTSFFGWDIKPLNLKHGWTELSLPLSSTGVPANFDISQPLNWFRFCLAHIPSEPDALRFFIKDVQLVDTTVLVDPPVVVQPDTTYLVGNIDYTMNSALANGVTFASGKGFTESPINALAHDKSQVYLMFDANITEQNPGDIFVLSRVSGQIELTSSGRSDVNEMTWGIGNVDWKAGQHTYMVPFSTGGKTGGDIDLSNINFIRFYAVNVPTDYTGHIQMAVTNVKIVDLTNRTKLPTLFSDKMMFQQNKPISIWGTANAGKSITVDIYKNDVKIDSKTVTVPESGNWKATFDSQTASFDKYRIEVLEGETLIQSINDILVGEVWLASGQSNMALSVAGTIDGSTLMANANNDNIRFFLEPTPVEATWIPNSDIQGAYWASGNDGMSVGKLSAVAYSMAVKLQEELNIPVGILNTAVGGSVIEAWLPAIDVQGDVELMTSMKRLGLYFDEDFYPSGNGQMSALYNLKINPLMGFGIKGMIWYQGESNSGRPQLYAQQLNLLKKSYERVFGFTNNDMPFIFCQVCPWVQTLEIPQYLAPLAEAMYDAWALNQDDMAMLPLYDTDITYVGNVVIHPTNKTPVGKRFAASALNLVYNHTGEYTAPVFESMSVSGNKITIRFSHVGDGLKSTNGIDDIRGFAVCGEDSIFVGAKARIISSNEVEVWNDRVAAPTQVTYAWATYNVKSNLANSVDIPATPFRSDRNTKFRYFNPQDWAYADGDIWGVNATDFVGFIPAWKNAPISGISNTSISYSTDVKSEGKAAMKLQFTPSTNAVVGVGPVLSNKSTVSQLNNFNTISVDVYSENNDGEKIGLWLKASDGKIYKATFIGYEGSDVVDTTVVIGDTPDFRTFTFNIKKLINDLDVEVEENSVANILQNITEIQFSLIYPAADSYSTELRTMYLDNVTFGISTDKLALPSGLKTQVESQIKVKLLGDMVNVLLDTNNPIKKIDLIDMQGRTIYTKSNINTYNYSFKLPAESGVFFAKILSEKFTKAYKIVANR